jgi:hypothetical protein
MSERKYLSGDEETAKIERGKIRNEALNRAQLDLNRNGIAHRRYENGIVGITNHEPFCVYVKFYCFAGNYVAILSTRYKGKEIEGREASAVLK